MAHDLHAAKRQAWSERLRRFARSGLTAAEFCRREGIPVVSFYEWRRKLSRRPPDDLDSTHRFPRASFVPVEIVSAAANGPPVEIHFPNG